MLVSGALDGCKKMREAGADNFPTYPAWKSLKKQKQSKFTVSGVCFSCGFRSKRVESTYKRLGPAWLTVLSCLVLSCRLLPCLLSLLCLVWSSLVGSCLLLSRIALPSCVCSCGLLSCLVLPCLASSCLALPCPVLSSISGLVFVLCGLAFFCLVFGASGVAFWRLLGPLDPSWGILGRQKGSKTPRGQ